MRAIGAGTLAAVMMSGCAYLDVAHLSDDATQGRDNGTAGSQLARQYLLDQLRPIANGVNPGAGDAAYLQAFSGGTNVLAVIPGTALPNEYVIVGAHYDHLGHSCPTANPSDTICNGATDNAAGVAAVLGVARDLAAHPARRSVLLALWDREEDGLLGSAYYVQHPVVPLAKTVGYINFDIQGANLRPSVRTDTFAVGSESGGPALQTMVRNAYATQTLDGHELSAIFGQGRSDYWNFLGAKIPTVFFSDSTGPCYHTAQDSIDVVDFKKLGRQIAVAKVLTRRLANAATPPVFVPGTPLATFDDALVLDGLGDRLWTDKDLFSSDDQASLAKLRSDTKAIIARGRAAFDSDAMSLLLGDAAAAVTLLTHGACDAFLAPAR